MTVSRFRVTGHILGHSAPKISDGRALNVNSAEMTAAGGGRPEFGVGRGRHKSWASSQWAHLTHTLHVFVHVLFYLPAQQSKVYNTGIHICKGRQPLSAHMYLTCITRTRMLGTDTTLLCGATRSDSFQACEVDQTCQYDQHGLHM
jgi:hypothetical protein